MYIRDLQGNEYYLQGTIKHDQELNGDERIDMDIHYTDINAEFLKKKEDLNMWIIIFENKEYRIISTKQTGHGDKYTVSVTGILYILDWLNTHRIYRRIDASLTDVEAFRLVFNDTPFNFNIVDKSYSNRFEGLGEGQTRLEMFKTFLDRYDYEMNIVGNVVYLKNKVGNDANFEYRYKVNANNISKDSDAGELWTYAQGYGNYSDDEEDKDVVDKAQLKREYTSPLESVIGERREAPPIRDGRIKQQNAMDNALKKLVDESMQISFSADIQDMREQGYNYQVATIGDRVFLVDERIGLDTEIRVVKIERTVAYTGQLLEIQITFGTTINADNYSSNLTTAVKDIIDIMKGRKSIPFTALDTVSKSMVSKIQNTSSELLFDDMGIHAIDKKNANNIVTMNSSGWMLSTDGGRTAKTALTAEGIVADTITTGHLDTNLVTIRSSSSDNYIEMKNDFIMSRGSFTRTWANETDVATLNLGIRKGHIMVSNEDTGYNLYMTEKGLSTMMAGASDDTAGTLEFHYQGYNETSRGVRLHSTYGAVALESDFSRIYTIANLTNNIESREYGVYIRPFKDSRPGTNEFNFYVKPGTEGTDTDGALLYGTITSPDAHYGSGIRFSKKLGLNTVYATNPNGDIGSGDFYANDLYGMLKAKETNQYIGVDGAVRITDMKGYNDGNVNYKDLQVKDIQAGSIRTHNGNFYIGCSSDEVRVTNNLLYNGGDIGYKPIKASDFKNASLEEYKENIEKWDFDALNQIANETDLYSFNYKSDKNKETKHGLIIGEGYKTPKELISGDSVNLYAMITWAFRAIQQLNKKIEVLENDR